MEIMKTSFFKEIKLILTCILLIGYSELSAQTMEQAITAMKNERYDRADSIFQILVKTAPSSKIYYLLGENTLLNFFSDSISNSLNVAVTEAKHHFQKGIELNPNDPLNYVGMAKVSFCVAENKSADEWRAKAKSLLPPYKKVSKIKNPNEYAYTLAKLADSYIIFDRVDTAKALPYIREALIIDQTNSEIYIITGDIYILVNNGSLAIKNYNRAQDLDPTSPTANMKIGSIYFKARNLMAAIPYFEQAIALNKNYAPAYRELGQLYSMAGRFKESKEYFETYLKLTDQNIPAKIRYVNALFYSKNYSEVIKNVAEIFAVDQSRTYLNRIAGYSSYEMGNYAQALVYMDRLFVNLAADRILKKDYIYYAHILVKKNQDYPKIYAELEIANEDLAKQKEKTESLKGPAKEKERANEEPLAAKVTEIQEKLNAADAELTKAYEYYEKAIAFGEDDISLIQEKAYSQFNNKRIIDAADTWKRLIDKGKASEENMLMIGRAYYQGKEYDKAEEIFNQMIAKYPEHINAYLWIANNASAKDPDAKGGLAKAKFIALLSKAATDSVKYENEIFDALRYLGYNAIQSKNYEDARKYYSRMINLDPNNKDFVVKALESMASLCTQLGEYDKAIGYDNKILAIDPSNTSAKSSIMYIQQVRSSAKPKADPNEISGVITNSSGMPIEGASVRVKDTAAEQWTNAKGEYRFTMPENSKALIISAKNYKAIEKQVTKSRVYNISLSRE
jgi:tetratricopeptide (TPR) repeat protein